MWDEIIHSQTSVVQPTPKISSVKWRQFCLSLNVIMGNPQSPYPPKNCLYIYRHPQACLFQYQDMSLTHWGRVTHICVSKLTIIGSDNGLSPNFSETLIVILTFSFKKMRMKVSEQGLKLTLIPKSDFLLLLSKSWSKSDRHRSYFLSLKTDIWLNWVAKFCS